MLRSRRCDPPPAARRAASSRIGLTVWKLTVLLVTLSGLHAAEAAVAGPGRQPGPGNTVVPCPKGTAKRGSGNFACTKCNGNADGGERFQPRTGATACAVCHGKVTDAARTRCIAGPGYQPGPDGIPQPCPPGLAKAGPGTFNCQPCDRVVNGNSYFTPFTASTRCYECPAEGTVPGDYASCTPGPGYQPGPNKLPVPCAKGTVKGGVGSYRCIPCNGDGARGWPRYGPDEAGTACLECSGVPNGGSVINGRSTCIPGPGYQPSEPLGRTVACEPGSAKAGTGTYL